MSSRTICGVGLLIGVIIGGLGVAVREAFSYPAHCYQHGLHVQMCVTRLDARHCRIVFTEQVFDVRTHRVIYTEHIGGKVPCKPVSQGGVR